ncbi:hypothetical protein [Chroococcidiopsis sp.]|uniref:hypothetical protein n=1 Tax=Chroococcidiopsis sp. TaxID=3088168 RepID=UPI003F673207
MCRYTSIFLKAVLEDCTHKTWFLVAGRPTCKEYEGTSQSGFGFRTFDGLFFDHCWVQSVNIIADITADQFGDEKVILTSVDDFRYHPNLAEANLRPDITKLSRRPAKWLLEWHNLNCIGDRNLRMISSISSSD